MTSDDLELPRMTSVTLIAIIQWYFENRNSGHKNTFLVIFKMIIFEFIFFALIIFELVIFELVISEVVIFHHFLSLLAHICIKKNIFFYHRIDLNIYGALEKNSNFQKILKKQIKSGGW